MAAKRKKTKRASGGGWKLTLLLFLLAVIGGAALLFTLDGRHVQFRLVGDAEISVPFGEDFIDPGRSAVTSGRLFGPSVQELPVETIGTVDTDRLGTYVLTYSTEYLSDTYTARRIVHVTDQTPPSLTLQTVDGYVPDWFNGYVEEGYLAWDNCDGDLTPMVQREVLGSKIEYRVTDRSGNETVAIRELPEMAPPEIQLKGGESITVSASLEFEDPGYTVTTGNGLDLSPYVTVEGEVIPYKLGSYELHYAVSNLVGDTVTASRTVVVEAAKIPATVAPDEKTIYLTFDDGPGPYTDALLDVLASYGVKATFFVTSLNPKYENCIGRAFREGHTVAVHTFSHNYYEIYASEKAYLDDFNKMEEVILRQTGEYSRLFRFPGGSSNTVSRFNPGIITSLAETMTAMGYQYFDWQVDSNDAGGTNSTEGVLENVVSGCEGRKTAVVLQHDVKDYSVEAVEGIIMWGLRNGYTFRALDITSPTAHHNIVN